MDKEKPICPILTIPNNPAIVHCQYERCAWWIEDKQKCAIAVMGKR